MRKFIIFIFCIAAFVINVSAQTETTNESERKVAKKANKRPDERQAKKEPFDEVDVKTMATKCVTLETGKGSIKLETYPESAPETVRNFLNLVATGAFDTTTFSRVVPNFVIQGGDLYTSEKLTNDLKWRAAENIPDEPNQIRHEKGILSMARSDEPNSASTSFFILLTTANTLDGKFAAFGKVVEGIEIVEIINKMTVVNEAPKKPVRINKAVIETCIIPEIETQKDTEQD